MCITKIFIFLIYTRIDYEPFPRYAPPPPPPPLPVPPLYIFSTEQSRSFLEFLKKDSLEKKIQLLLNCEEKPIEYDKIDDLVIKLLLVICICLIS